MLRIVTATRHDFDGFKTQTLLGLSLRRLEYDPEIQIEVFWSNTAGLPEAYNRILNEAGESETILFVHDDVQIDDWFLSARLEDALATFDVVGVVGNKRRVARQPSWAYVDDQFTKDEREHFSGAVGHFMGEFCRGVDYFGKAPQLVKSLDGLLLAARVKKLRDAGVQFDPRFPFHFYDMDFCRTCEQAGLTLGTWPIAVSHGSAGALEGEAWNSAYVEYLAKWKA